LESVIHLAMAPRLLMASFSRSRRYSREKCLA